VRLTAQKRNNDPCRISNNTDKDKRYEQAKELVHLLSILQLRSRSWGTAAHGGLDLKEVIVWICRAYYGIVLKLHP